MVCLENTVAENEQGGRREAEASTLKALHARLQCGEPQKDFRQGSRQLRLEFQESHSSYKGSIDRRGKLRSGTPARRLLQRF